MGYDTILGKKLVGINGHPLTSIIDSLSSLMALDNESMRKNYLPGLLNHGDLLAYFDFSEKTDCNLQLENEESRYLFVSRKKLWSP